MLIMCYQTWYGSSPYAFQVTPAMDGSPVLAKFTHDSCTRAAVAGSISPVYKVSSRLLNT